MLQGTIELLVLTRLPLARADARISHRELDRSGKGLILFPTVVAMMFAVGLLAAAGPARRGLAVQPTKALRNE